MPVDVDGDGKADGVFTPFKFRQPMASSAQKSQRSLFLRRTRQGAYPMPRFVRNLADEFGDAEKVEEQVQSPRQIDFSPQVEEVPLPTMNSRKRSRTVMAPVAVTSSVNYKSVNRVITLAGREFWQDVVSNGTTNLFSASGRLLRPTDSELFSWLAPIAAKFEEFKFSKLRFIYEPQCPSTEPGQVGLYFDGDPTHVPPANWNNLINTGANTHGAVWSKQILDVPSWLFASRSSYYTICEFGDVNNTKANSVVPTDPIEYYPGVFGFASEGCGAAKVLGKIYLEYQVSLKTQNVDGFNQTSVKGAVLSAETAANSGTGYFEKLSAFPAGTPSTPIGSGTVYASIRAGSGYFEYTKVDNYLLAKQSFDVLLAVRVTGAAPQTVSFKYAPLPDAGVAPTFVAMTDATPVKVKAIADNMLPANDYTGLYQLSFKPNYLFQIVVTGAAPTYFHWTMAPFVYPIAT